MPPHPARPQLESIPNATFSLGGEIGARLAAVTDGWILPAVKSNPAMLEMFRARDQKPYTIQWSWVGEYAGKYLTHAAQVYQLTRDERLRAHLDWFVGELVSLQADDGYLGPWPKAWRLRKGAPNRRLPPDKPPREAWDAWGHYHLVLGLLLWHQYTGDARALACAMRIGDLLCRRFLDGPERLADTGELEMNLAPIHGLMLLYKVTGAARYLRLALEIEKDFERPGAGNYVRAALAGLEFFQMPAPRWESLHAIQGIFGLYLATGDEQYRRAFEHIWWSIAQGDRHNNGGFSSGERATGDPYDTGPIETCCTVAWMALSVDMLRLTGNPLVADELELSMLNSGLGLISASGRWVTYSTPMDGFRQGWFQDIGFHSQAGGPELSCCAVNGPRTLGMLCDWAVMHADGGLWLNYYGPGAITAPLPSGNPVRLTQTTDYPAGEKVDILVQPARPEEFCLGLRIPRWSEQTAVRVNSEAVAGVTAGRYLPLKRRWEPGDRVSLEFDFRPHFWVNSRAAPPRETGPGAYRPTSIYRGPILVAHDPRFDPDDTEALPGLSAAGLAIRRVEAEGWLPAWMLLEVKTDEGRPLRVCDFASAGAGGQYYRSWLPVRGAPAVEFSRDNPLRSGR